MKFQCQHCGQEHENPYDGFKAYYEGLAHQKSTGEILIWHRYNDWIKPEQGEGFPGEGCTVEKSVDGPVKKGDYIWHGGADDHVNAWIEVTEDQDVYYGNAVVARKQ